MHFRICELKLNKSKKEFNLRKDGRKKLTTEHTENTEKER